ncbi:MAG: hypothetical protein AB4040_13620 [Synechococcus sp.]
MSDWEWIDLMPQVSDWLAELPAWEMERMTAELMHLTPAERKRRLIAKFRLACWSNHVRKQSS